MIICLMCEHFKLFLFIFYILFCCSCWCLSTNKQKKNCRQFFKREKGSIYVFWAFVVVVDDVHIIYVYFTATFIYVYYSGTEIFFSLPLLCERKRLNRNKRARERTSSYWINKQPSVYPYNNENELDKK